MCHVMYILKASKFQVWKSISKSRLGNFLAKNRVNRGKFFIYGGSKFEIFWNFSFSTYFYYQNGCCVKIWVKTKKTSWFYSIFLFKDLTIRFLFFVQRSIPKSGAPHAVRSVRFAPYQIFWPDFFCLSKRVWRGILLFCFTTTISSEVIACR